MLRALAIFVLACLLNLSDTSPDFICSKGELPVSQKFPIPTTPLGLTSDLNYVYVAQFGDNMLYGYKRNSNGLLMGTDYSNSVNISITLPEAVSSFLQFAKFNNFLFYSDYGSWIRVIDTTKRTVLQYNVGVSKIAYVAADKFGFVYGLGYGKASGSDMHFYVYNFSNPNNYNVGDFSVKPEVQIKCAFAITSDDKVYISMSSKKMNVYSIKRDKFNKPLGFDLLSSMNVTSSSCCCLLQLCVNKDSKNTERLVGLGMTKSGVGTNSVPIFSENDAAQKTYCTPGFTQDLQSLWSDDPFGFTILTGDPVLFLSPNTV